MPRFNRIDLLIAIGELVSMGPRGELFLMVGLKRSRGRMTSTSVGGRGLGAVVFSSWSGGILCRGRVGF